MTQPPSHWMLEPIRKYATFRGRARRAEYWWYALFSGLLAGAATIADIVIFGLLAAAGTGVGPVTGLLSLALFLPSFAVSVRRLHDTDRSGWWVLLGLVPLIGGLILLIWFCTSGTRGPNTYGADPLD